MPPPDDRSALRDVQHYCQRIVVAVEEMTEDSFNSDDIATAAVERWLGIIGEAVKRLTPDFRESHPEVDWRSWAGLRDILVHAYAEVELKQIWTIASVEVGELLGFVDRYLEVFGSA